VNRRIAGYELSLGEGWTIVPPDLSDVDSWSREQAARLVPAGTGPVFPQGPDGSTRGVDGADAGVDPVALLADGIAAVARAAAGTQIDALAVAFMARRPETGMVEAMLTVVGQEGLGADEFAADLERSVSGSDDPAYLYAQAIEGTVPAGEVRGAHLMIGHVDSDLGQEVAHLEERVALGVFPSDCPDMIEVTAVANGVSVFDDMPRAIVDLLAGLTIELEAA
jgi:hypothetical protein